MAPACCRGTSVQRHSCPVECDVLPARLNAEDLPEMGRCVCVIPAEDAPGPSAGTLPRSGGAHRPLLLPRSPVPCARPPDRHLTPGRGRESPSGQPDCCPHVPLPSAAEGGGTSREKAGPRPAPPRRCPSPRFPRSGGRVVPATSGGSFQEVAILDPFSRIYSRRAAAAALPLPEPRHLRPWPPPMWNASR